MKTQFKNQNNLQIELKKRKRQRIVLITLLCLVLIPLIATSVAVGSFAIWANTQSVDKSLLPTATAVPTYYDIDGNPLPHFESDFVEIENISDNLRYAFVALEDKRFYQHKGYDVVRMAGAMVKNLKSGAVREGASTITQQLVKNTHLTQERTLSRKLKELAIAIQLEKEYSKDEILAMYLSVIYFGGGAYGVKQAANTYFGKNIEDLSLDECAVLAGIVRNPSKYSPTKYPENCLSRRNLVLSLMKSQGYIDSNSYEKAIASPIVTVNSNKDTVSTQLSAKLCEFYINQAQKEVCRALGITKYQLNNSGLKIYTNLNTDLQRELENQRVSSNNFESDSVNSVSVILDNKTGAVLAYSSSYPYTISRQAGSVLKPLAVYAPALEEGLISLATPIIDEKTDFGGYSPDNFGGIYYGDTTVREAIKKSMNSVSVKIMDYLGADKSVSYLKKVGIKLGANDASYALALGATGNGVSPLDVANAYSAIARGGEYLSPSFVRFVVDGGEKILSNSENNTSDFTATPYSNLSAALSNSKAFSSSTCALITSALRDTVKYGTAKSLSVLPFEVAAKTGTAQRTDDINSDAWNASYNSQYTVLVWHGNDDGISERGGGYPTRHALNIWRAIADKKAIVRSFESNFDTYECEIDVYSTKLNRHVVAATPNTPLEYRKTELFSLKNIPSSSGSKFDSIAPIKLNAINENGKINLSFDSEIVYVYELYRTDVTGTKLIFNEIGTGETISYKDLPVAFDGKVQYTLICHLKNNEEISSSSTQSVYVKSVIS